MSTGAATDYVFGVTEPQFWARVGREFALIRARAGYDKPYTAYRAGGPATGTISDIESGRVGNVDSLAAYAKWLNVSLLDVLRIALSDDEDEYSFSADARFVARMFQEGPNEDLREAILAAARAQHALQRAGHGSSRELPDDDARAATAGRGRGRTARNRR